MSGCERPLLRCPSCSGGSVARIGPDSRDLAQTRYATPVSSGNGLAGGLRVLIANEEAERLAQLAPAIAGIGHVAIARDIDAADVATVTLADRPDVALVKIGAEADAALAIIAKIVREAVFPALALVEPNDADGIAAAARSGVFAYLVDTSRDELRSAIEIALKRFAEFHNLQDAFERRALIEQSKGILMARHGLDADHAFAMLRDHSQHGGKKLFEVAEAIVDSHLLLVPPA